MTGPGEGGSRPLVGVDDVSPRYDPAHAIDGFVESFPNGAAFDFLVSVKVDERPKSAILSVLLVEVSLCTSRFSGLRSRCAMPLNWQ